MKKEQNTEKTMGIDTPQELAGENVNNSSSYELVERMPIDGTPFEIVKEERGIMLAMGKYQITDWNKDATTRELKALVTKRDWGLIMTVASIVAEDVIKQIVNNNKEK